MYLESPFYRWRVQQTDGDICNCLVVDRSGPGGVCYEEWWSGVMAITVACHAEPIARSGAVSVVVTCQRVVKPRGIRHRKWSRVVAITVACHVEPIVGSGAESWPLLWSARESRPVGRSSVEVSGGER